jgi:hypothetical protein
LRFAFAWRLKTAMATKPITKGAKAVITTVEYGIVAVNTSRG